jgi:hypothetical protein
MRFTSGKFADARDALARIESDPHYWSERDGRGADRRSLIFLLRRYGRSRSGLLSIRPPNWHPGDGIPRHSSWENRLIFCLDVEMVLASMASPRHRFVLQQCYAMDRDRVDVARELNVCTRTLCRLQDCALDAMLLKCRALGVAV